MDAAEFRAKAQRCRDLLRVAVGDDVRQQLREWAQEFEAEAETIEAHRHRSRKATGD
jgi:hypothetical protein